MDFSFQTLHPESNSDPDVEDKDTGDPQPPHPIPNLPLHHTTLSPPNPNTTPTKYVPHPTMLVFLNTHSLIVVAVARNFYSVNIHAWFSRFLEVFRR